MKNSRLKFISLVMALLIITTSVIFCLSPNMLYSKEKAPMDELLKDATVVDSDVKSDYYADESVENNKLEKVDNLRNDVVINEQEKNKMIDFELANKFEEAPLLQNSERAAMSSFEFPSSVEEQLKGDYDKHVDKDTTKWEENWAASTVLPTTKVSVTYDSNSTKAFFYESAGAVASSTSNSLQPLTIALTLCEDSFFEGTNNCVLNASSERTYKGISSGAIQSGLLIVEKSYDASDWKRVDSQEYANGLFTTNFRTHYGSGNTVQIYAPSGADLNRGIYVRVTYVYEAKHTFIEKNLFGFDTTKTKDKIFREQSVVYLCNENINAVTIHNLSTVNNAFGEGVRTDDGAHLEEYYRAETLVNNSMTYTGFQVDNSLASVNVTVLHNGTKLDIPSDGKFTSAGKYDIIISQRFGNEQKIITVYIEMRSSSQIKNYYFPNNFITGKRIFWEGKYPKFEGGLSSYNIGAIEAQYPAIYGTIENVTTKTVVKISGDRELKNVVLTEPGEYVAKFYNNPTFLTDTPAGDTFIITYRFNLIEEGTAPGPQVNKDKLAEFVTNNVSDYFPKYYGVTYSSAGPGNITIAFSNYKDAFDFAYNYEKGCVEKQADGSFRYSGKLKVGVKEQYNSLWDITDATNFFAEQAVQTLYFDLTDDFTYLTLHSDYLEDYKNLRTMELLKSIVAFRSDEERINVLCQTELPIIALRKYQYLIPGLDGKVLSGVTDFEFVKDTNGYDSHSVVIIDSTGKEIPIQHRQGVAAQLQAANCATGVITIREATVYGDQIEYQAIYIGENVNTVTATITYFKNHQKQTSAVSQTSTVKEFEVNAFSFDWVDDEFDPYGMVKVVANGKETLYLYDDIIGKSWNDIGNYKIIFINRFGYSYEINFVIKTPYYISVLFTGEGTEGLSTITVPCTQDTLTLPVLVRYGYYFRGFKDEVGNVYKDVIEFAPFVESITLTPVWEPKPVTLIIKDNNGKILQQVTLNFGEKHILIDPILMDGGEFLGWIYEGKEFTEASIVVQREDSVEIIANIRYAADDSDEDFNDPTDEPTTDDPADKPTTDDPADKPTDEPTNKPADDPTDKPSDAPIINPTDDPTNEATDEILKETSNEASNDTEDSNSTSDGVGKDTTKKEDGGCGSTAKISVILLIVVALLPAIVCRKRKEI